MLPQASDPARMFVLFRRGSGYHRNYGLESVCCYSRLNLTPLRKRPSAPQAFVADCLSRNISNLVVHDVDSLRNRSMSTLLNVNVGNLLGNIKLPTRQATMLCSVPLKTRCCRLQLQHMVK
ncbi:hypothetical protein QYF36_018895 [Acer negundo]|nr:hypothetical protein QYF36_018895 [Acer negundo]